MPIATEGGPILPHRLVTLTHHEQTDFGTNRVQEDRLTVSVRCIEVIFLLDENLTKVHEETSVPRLARNRAPCTLLSQFEIAGDHGFFYATFVAGIAEGSIFGALLD